MQNLMALFSFSVIHRKHSSLGKFGAKNQNCQFKLKFGTRLIRVLRIQWWCLLFLFYTVDTLFSK